MADFDVYAEQLFSLNNGHALYDPDPSGKGYDEVHIGDVGYIQRGAFHRLFNICRDEDDPSHERFGVPEYFEPIPVKDRETFPSPALPRGLMSSSSVRDLGGSIGASVSLGIGTAANLKIKRDKRRGAALIINDYAYRLDALSKRAFSKSIRENCDTWYAFAKYIHNRDVELRDIVLVTGRDLTTEWAMTTFDETVRDVEISFDVGQTPITSGEFSLWGKWSTTVHVPHRCGPTPTGPPPPQGTFMITDGSSSSNSTKKFNQCIFVRGYRIFHRFLRIPIEIKASAEPKDLDEDPSPPSGNPTTNLGFEDDNFVVADLDSFSAGNRSPDVYDVLSEFVFATSDADLALIHDDDVCAIMTRDIEDASDLQVKLYRTHFFDIELEEQVASETGDIKKVGRLRKRDIEEETWNAPFANVSELLKPEGTFLSNDDLSPKTSTLEETEEATRTRLLLEIQKDTPDSMNERNLHDGLRIMEAVAITSSPKLKTMTEEKPSTSRFDGEASASGETHSEYSAKVPDAFNVDLADSLHGKALTLLNTKRYEEALEAFSKAVSIRQGLADSDPDAFNAVLADSLYNLGFTLFEFKRHEEALEAYTKAVSIRQGLADSDPAAFNAVLAISLNSMGTTFYHLKRHEESLEAYTKAVSIRQGLADSDPYDFNEVLAGSLYNLSISLSMLKRHEEALEANMKAVSILQGLADSDPDAFNAVLADSLDSMGTSLYKLKRYEEALEADSKAVSIRQNLANSDPETFNVDLAGSLYKLGITLSELKRHEEALEACSKAIFIRQGLADSDPDAFNAVLADSLHFMGIGLYNLERHEEALEADSKAVSIRQRLTDSDPETFNVDLAISLNSMGTTLYHLNRHEEALEAYTKAVCIRQGLADSDSAAFNADLAESLNSMGTTFYNLNRHHEALEAYTKAVSIRQGLADSDLAAFNADLAESLNSMGITLYNLNRHHEALEAYTKAVSIRQGLADGDQETFNPVLGDSLHNAALTLSKLGRHEEALEAASKAVSIRRGLADSDSDSYNADLFHSLQNMAFTLSNLNMDMEAQKAISTIRIPLAYPYILPAPMPPSMPRTRRRNMLSQEQSENLRRNLPWDRQARNMRPMGGRRRVVTPRAVPSRRRLGWTGSSVMPFTSTSGTTPMP